MDEGDWVGGRTTNVCYEDQGGEPVGLGTYWVPPTHPTPPHPTQVDGSKVSLPFCLQGQAVCLAPRGATTLLVADFGLRVTAGPGAAVAVTVSPSFRNVTCGLCGNFDGHPYNDHLHQATTATCHRPCPGPTCPPCRQPPKKAFVHTELCGVLRDPQGPFGGCHAAVHPRVFFDVCLWELCEAPGDKEVLSEVLGAYEAACRQAKVRVGPWRVPSVCRELGTAGTRGGRWPWGVLGDLLEEVLVWDSTVARMSPWIHPWVHP